MILLYCNFLKFKPPFRRETAFINGDVQPLSVAAHRIGNSDCPVVLARSDSLQVGAETVRPWFPLNPLGRL